MDPIAVRHAKDAAARFRAMGYQPLPSDPRPHSEGGRKKPLCRFAEWWEAPAPDDLFERFETTNIQVMTGRYWGLAVLDLDGKEGVEHVRKHWVELPRTWVSRSGDHGEHHWFTVGRNWKEKRKCRLWGVWEPETRDGKGDWRPHVGVELLCDRSLVMAPPSIHPKTGRKYVWEYGCSPRDMDRPAMAPPWLWSYPEMKPPQPDREWQPAAPLMPSPPRSERKRVPDWRRVVEAIPDKAALVRTWGLRFARNACESEGWVSVHDFNREDKNPSARFNIRTGQFWRPGEPPISLPWLGVAMGVYRDVRECVAALADWYGFA